MAYCDKATDAQAADFADKKAKILFSASTWDFGSRKYLEAVLDQLEMMTAFYSYGNGDIAIDNHPIWETLDPAVVIPMINGVIKPDLDIEVFNINNTFPTRLWFEIEDLVDEL